VVSLHEVVENCKLPVTFVVGAHRRSRFRSLRSALVHAVDVIVVGRISRAALDLVYAEADEPGVRTRYDVQALQTIKGDSRLPTSPTFFVLHRAGEVDWQGTILVGCERTVMKENGTYVLFLRWDETSGAFWPARGNELLANISTGDGSADAQEQRRAVD
jgi:hypothetical protein